MTVLELNELVKAIEEKCGVSAAAMAAPAGAGGGAAAAVVEEKTEFTVMLLEAGAKLTPKTKEGYTAFLMAVRGGNTPVATALLDKGASLKDADADGGNASINASQYDRPEMVSFQLTAGMA